MSRDSEINPQPEDETVSPSMDHDLPPEDSSQHGRHERPDDSTADQDRTADTADDAGPESRAEPEVGPTPAGAPEVPAAAAPDEGSPAARNRPGTGTGEAGRGDLEQPEAGDLDGGPPATDDAGGTAQDGDAGGDGTAGGALPGPGMVAGDSAQVDKAVETEDAESADEHEEKEPERRGRSTAGALIGVLLALLGFALAVQVRSNTSTSGLTSARQEDLVRILDELSSREDRLRRQIASLESAKARLSTTGDRSEVALSEARTRSTALGILAGTLPAQGPGIQLTLVDPQGKLTAEDLLDAVEELRAAGAEAIQVGDVRIGLDSSFTATDDGLAVDGRPVDAPYTILAIGDPQTMATAMEIPGGVTDTARRAGGEARIAQQQRLVIRALRTLRQPQYSRPADGGR